MDYKKPYNLLKTMPPKLNTFYKKKSSLSLVINNKSY